MLLTTLSDTCEHGCFIRAVCWIPIWLPFMPGKLLSGANKQYAKVDMLTKLVLQVWRQSHGAIGSQKSFSYQLTQERDINLFFKITF